MGINILNLNVPEAVIIKRDSVAFTPKKIDPQKLKDSLAAAKENGQLGDLLQLSGVDKNSVLSIKSNPQNQAVSYTMDSFFRKDMPLIKNSDGNYQIEKVSFTEDELKKARNMMMTAVKQIHGEAGIKSTLDYKDYAAMSLAENAVNSYAKDNFNEEQQNIIAKAMKGYMDGLDELQKKTINSAGFGKTEYGDFSDYYGLGQILDDTSAKAMNELREEMERVSGRTYGRVSAGQVIGSANIATNNPLIEKMKSLFSNVDLDNKDDFDNAVKRYNDLIRPAYVAYGMERNLDSIIGRDADKFNNMLEAIRLSSMYKPVDISL